MVAFSASRLVWLAISSMMATTVPMRSTAWARVLTIASVRFASSTAEEAMVVAWFTCRPTSPTESVISATAAATAPILVLVCPEDAATAADRPVVPSAIRVISLAVPTSSVAEDARTPTNCNIFSLKLSARSSRCLVCIVRKTAWTAWSACKTSLASKARRNTRTARPTSPISSLRSTP